MKQRALDLSAMYEAVSGAATVAEQAQRSASEAAVRKSSPEVVAQAYLAAASEAAAREDFLTAALLQRCGGVSPAVSASTKTVHLAAPELEAFVDFLVEIGIKDSERHAQVTRRKIRTLKTWGG